MGTVVLKPQRGWWCIKGHVGRGSTCKGREVQGCCQEGASWAESEGGRAAGNRTGEAGWLGKASGQANELGACPTGSRTMERVRTKNNVSGGMCTEGSFLERPDSTVVAAAGVEGDSKAFGADW